MRKASLMETKVTCLPFLAVKLLEYQLEENSFKVVVNDFNFKQHLMMLSFYSLPLCGFLHPVFLT